MMQRTETLRDHTFVSSTGIEPSVDLSVVIPVYNEEQCLPELHRRLTDVMLASGRSYELIYIDDGSMDESLALLRRFSLADARTRFISLTRNFGQSAATTAGQVASRGVGVICIDADLQNPPEEIPKLLTKFDEGYEVVYGIRRHRRDPWLRRAGSATMTWLLRKCMGVSVNPDVTAFSIAHRRIVDELNRCPEQIRFQPVLYAWLGARTTHVDVAHAARFDGQSKYSYWQLFKRAVDLLTGYTLTPLRLASIAGLVFSMFGFAMALWAIIRKLTVGDTLLGWASIMAAIGVLGGVQLLTIGTLGEYLGRSYNQLLGRPLYVVRESQDNLLAGSGSGVDEASNAAPASEKSQQVHEPNRSHIIQQEAAFP